MSSTSDDDFLPADGYDPSEVVGYDDQQDYADLADAVPDPVRPLYGSERTGALSDLLEEELDAVAKGFRDRRDREAERYELATNSDYWMCLCFSTQAQRTAFLTGTGWRDLGIRFLDGRALAKRLGIDLPADPEWPNSRRDSSWDNYAMTAEDNHAIDL
jgi:hypothetical protein